MTVEAVVEQPSDQLSALEPSATNMEEDNNTVELEIASNVDHRRVNEESVSEDKVSSSQSCAITKEIEGHTAEEATKQLETQVSYVECFP